MELNQEVLLSVPIRDDEIFELLERLAATEEMFKTPVSTIRDVVELTEASPSLIARLLGEMRGPGEYEKLVGLIARHNNRLGNIETRVETLERRGTSPVTANDRQLDRVEGRVNPLARKPNSRHQLTEEKPNLESIHQVVIVIVVLIVSIVAVASINSPKPISGIDVGISGSEGRTYGITVQGRELSSHNGYTIYENLGDRQVELKENDPAYLEARSTFFSLIASNQKKGRG